MLSIEPTGKEWTVLLPEWQWDWIVMGLVRNQFVQTKQPIGRGDTVYFCCTDNEEFEVSHRNYVVKGAPEKSGIIGGIKFIDCIVTVASHGHNRKGMALKSGFVSIDFLVKNTGGETEEGLESRVEARQAEIDDPSNHLSIVKK